MILSRKIDFDDQGMENAMGHSIGCSAENRLRPAMETARCIVNQRYRAAGDPFRPEGT